MFVISILDLYFPPNSLYTIYLSLALSLSDFTQLFGLLSEPNSPSILFYACFFVIFCAFLSIFFLLCPFVMEKYRKKLVLMQKQMIFTRKWPAEHRSAGRNTKHEQFPASAKSRLSLAYISYQDNAKVIAALSHIHLVKGYAVYISSSSLANVQFSNISVFPLWGLFSQSLLNIGPIAYIDRVSHFSSITRNLF